MQAHVLKALVVGLLFLLAGCQAGPVRSLENTFQSFGAPRQTLAESVQSALSRSEDPMVAQVHVSMNQNTVVLSGYVKKIRQSDTAEQIARQVPGIQELENRIIVRP